MSSVRISKELIFFFIGVTPKYSVPESFPKVSADPELSELELKSQNVWGSQFSALSILAGFWFRTNNVNFLTHKVGMRAVSYCSELI